MPHVQKIKNQYLFFDRLIFTFGEGVFLGCRWFNPAKTIDGCALLYGQAASGDVADDAGAFVECDFAAGGNAAQDLPRDVKVVYGETGPQLAGLGDFHRPAGLDMGLAANSRNDLIVHADPLVASGAIDTERSGADGHFFAAMIAEDIFLTIKQLQLCNQASCISLRRYYIRKQAGDARRLFLWTAVCDRASFFQNALVITAGLIVVIECLAIVIIAGVV